MVGFRGVGRWRWAVLASATVELSMSDARCPLTDECRAMGFAHVCRSFSVNPTHNTPATPQSASLLAYEPINEILAVRPMP